MFDKNEIVENLKSGICKVIFTKNNGEDRVMSCTLNEEILPEQVALEELTNTRKGNPDVLAVWDTDIGAWRSFRWDSIKEFKKEIDL